MRITSMVLFKPFIAVILLVNIFNYASAACLIPNEKAASIAQKSQASSYVFDGVVTKITDTYVTVKVSQYFKGSGLSEIKIAPPDNLQNGCTDSFVIKQRALFFTEGDMEKGVLESVYDGQFGSIRAMNMDNFADITTTTQCMAHYKKDQLTIPCIIHQENQKFYHADLVPSHSATGLTFSVDSVSNLLLAHFPTTKCVAIYQNGQLSVPCVAHQDSQAVYQVTLVPINSSDGLKFAVSHASGVSHINDLINFDTDKVGTVPKGWLMGLTGTGDTRWEIEADRSAPSGSMVLTQLAEGYYPWCIKKETRIADGFVSVKFKPISGRIDQAAGLIWRWKDENNYYVARANALEDNVSIYYMKDGSRFKIKYQDVPKDSSVDRNKWQSLRVDFQGNRFIVSFEGQVIMDVTDDHITGDGAVGVWTKEDSVTSFDDFSYGQ